MLALAALTVTLALAFAFGRLAAWLTRDLQRPARAVLGVSATLVPGCAFGWVLWPSYASPVVLLLWWTGALAGTAAGRLRATAGRHA
ncbi:hypothetical protein LE181_29810 [Streptomyces sp. SCA3-4]|uniref:hypothetical protein n=1 Tax=Streptomyces sichuanensis TaxID=2871810 RepID=UPI001CE2AEC8|nr:hypothetical protein [Streptomyces sichuanensis]MCA6096349.1 hypothetical protein [Streptomyces sichuanensis]